MKNTDYPGACNCSLCSPSMLKATKHDRAGAPRRRMELYPEADRKAVILAGFINLTFGQAERGALMDLLRHERAVTLDGEALSLAFRR